MGRWNYSGEMVSKPCGDDVTYKLGAAWLHGLRVEDWGGGLGWYKQHHVGEYINVDESSSKFVDVTIDLRAYTSTVDGIFMRHVLEHNGNWRLVLRNAMRSFRRRMFLAIFTPLEINERVMSETDIGGGVRIPEIAMREKDLLVRMGRTFVKKEQVASATRYGAETVFYLERP